MADERRQLPPQAIEMLRKMYDAGESEENIAEVINHFKQQPQTFWEKHPNFASVARSTIDALPAIGGAIGFTLGSGSGVGAVPGAITGAALGRTVRNPLMAATGLEAPKSPLTTIGEAATDAAVQGALPAVSLAKQGIKEVPGAVTRLAQKPLATGAAGAVLGGYEGYRVGGVPGAVIGAATGGTLGMSPKVNPLLRTLSKAAGPAETEAEAAQALAPKGVRAMTEMPSKVGAPRALELSRKAVLTPEEVQELKTLLESAKRGASEAGMIHAAAGKVE